MAYLYYTGQQTNRHLCSVQKTFATGAQLKQPLYVCIGQRFGWEIYFPLLSELNRFRPFPFRELVWHLRTQMNIGNLAV